MTMDKMKILLFSKKVGYPQKKVRPKKKEDPEKKNRSDPKKIGPDFFSVFEGTSFFKKYFFSDEHRKTRQTTRNTSIGGLKKN
jgi:hypothetical protein